MISLFLDGADLATIRAFADRDDIKGFTTNPSLMRQAGVTDYERFAKDLLLVIPEKPVSFEVLADEPYQMTRQGILLATWGHNVVVKIPIMNTRGVSMGPVIQALTAEGVTVNVTAILTEAQAQTAISAFTKRQAGYLSVFAGRIADTGRDPIPLVETLCSEMAGRHQVIWASTREALNVRQAEQAGCDIITVTPAILAKLPLFGKDLHAYTLETVRMFEQDGRESGLTLC